MPPPNLTQFRFVDDEPVDIYNLRPGEFFAEDCSYDVHKVLEVRQVEGEMVVFAHNITRNIPSAWSYTETAYAPVVYRVKSK